MKRQRVHSSNLASIGYDANEKRLEVEFLNGTIYEYYNVPQQLYERLMSASSHGKFFIAHIKNGGFQFQQIA